MHIVSRRYQEAIYSSSEGQIKSDHKTYDGYSNTSIPTLNSWPIVHNGKRPCAYSQVNEMNHHKMGEEYPMLEASLYHFINLKIDFKVARSFSTILEPQSLRHHLFGLQLSNSRLPHCNKLILQEIMLVNHLKGQNIFPNQEAAKHSKITDRSKLA